ncbi:MAG: hypothetical protein AAB580_02915, partial [Patescibacteria group bacterium]
MAKYKIILLVFLIGFILRLLLPMERVFNFDQDQIALNAMNIVKGDWTALGPQTSHMSFYTGPLIYYWAAVFYGLTGGHPLANTLTSAAIYVFSFWLIWYFFKSLLPLKITQLYLAIFALSPYLVQLNRITWNPNFSFLSGSLVLAALLKPNQLSLWLGMFLAYQSNFSGFVMVAVLLLYWLFNRQQFKLIVVGFFGLLSSMLPLITFDFRHNFMNITSLGNFIYKAIFEMSFGFLPRIKNVLMINFENFTKLLSGYFYPGFVLVLLGISILILWLIKPRSYFSSAQKKTLLLWMAVFPFAALFYDEGLPEYYFLMQLPALIFMLTDLLIGNKNRQLLAGLFMMIISLGVIFDNRNGYSLREKYAAAKYIQNQSAGRPVQIVFDMDYRERFGWDYLFQYF